MEGMTRQRATARRRAFPAPAIVTTVSWSCLALALGLFGCAGRSPSRPDAAHTSSTPDAASAIDAAPDLAPGLAGQGGAGGATLDAGGGAGGQGGSGQHSQQGYEHLIGPCDVPGGIVAHEGRLAPCPGGCATGCSTAYCLCRDGQWACACPTCPSLELGDQHLACRDCAGTPTCTLADAGGLHD
jgi:hypothetical protein